jgi:hypothetical protein
MIAPVSRRLRQAVRALGEHRRTAARRPDLCFTVDREALRQSFLEHPVAGIDPDALTRT